MYWGKKADLPIVASLKVPCRCRASFIACLHGFSDLLGVYLAGVLWRFKAWGAGSIGKGETEGHTIYLGLQKDWNSTAAPSPFFVATSQLPGYISQPFKRMRVIWYRNVITTLVAAGVKGLHNRGPKNIHLGICGSCSQTFTEQLGPTGGQTGPTAKKVNEILFH